MIVRKNTERKWSGTKGLILDLCETSQLQSPDSFSSQPSFPSPLPCFFFLLFPPAYPSMLFFISTSAGHIPSKRPLPCRSYQLSHHSFPSCSALMLTSLVWSLFFSLHTQQVADFLQLQSNSIISKPQCDWRLKEHPLWNSLHIWVGEIWNPYMEQSLTCLSPTKFKKFHWCRWNEGRVESFP